MKRMLVLAALAALVLAGLLISQDATYVGAQKCAMCHKSDAQGRQFVIWEGTKHAKSLEALTSPKAAEAAKAMGVDKPADDPKCLKCHLVGYECPKDIKAKIKDSDAVGCEACHGAGKDYAKQDIMKDLKASIEKGFVLPTEKVCVKCHNKESPTFKEFDFKEAAKKIAHPNPKLQK